MSGGELPEGWIWVTTADVAANEPNALTIGPFGSNLKVSDYTSEGVPLIFVRDIRAERFGGTGTKFVSSAKSVELRSHAAAPGDLLITKMGEPPGDTAVYPADCPRAIITADCIKLTPNNRLTSSAYLRYCIRASVVREQVAQQAMGVAQQKLSLARFKEVRLPLPPLPEQRRIVEKVEALLADVNAARERLAKVPLILKRFRQAVLAAACSGRLTEEWRRSHPGTDVQPLLASLGAKNAGVSADVAEIPESWAWIEFAAAVTNHDGKRVPVKSSDRDQRRGQYPYYGASGVIDNIDGYLFDGHFLLIAEDGANLLSRSTPIAFPASGKFWVNNHAHVVQPRDGVVQKFLELQLNSLDLQDYVTGTAQPKLTQAALNRIPIALPPTDEQSEIVRRVEALFAVADAIEERVKLATACADTLPQAILSKAFRGELVPTEAELARAEGRSHETAEEMLARVTASAPEPAKAKGRRKAFTA